MEDENIYVLVGADTEKEALKASTQAWKNRADKKGDVVMVYPVEGETPGDTIRKLNIEGHVLLLAHGGENGSFTWEKDTSHSYTELFQSLSQKCKSVTIGGCYGESALTMMKDVPPGVLLQAAYGAKSVGWSDSLGQLSETATKHKHISAETILLEALAAVDPEQASKNAIAWNEKYKEKTPVNTSPNDVLPHTIGIGGRPPMLLDLNQQMAALAEAGKYGALDKKLFQQSIAHVKEHFHIKSGSDKEVLLDAVAKQISTGENMDKLTLQEKRYGYALTIANMYDTGNMNIIMQGVAENTEAHTQYLKQIVAATRLGKIDEVYSKGEILGNTGTSWNTISDIVLSGDQDFLTFKKDKKYVDLNGVPLVPAKAAEAVTAEKRAQDAVTLWKNMFAIKQGLRGGKFDAVYSSGNEIAVQGNDYSPIEAAIKAHGMNALTFSYHGAMVDLQQGTIYNPVTGKKVLRPVWQALQSQVDQAVKGLDVTRLSAGELFGFDANHNEKFEAPELAAIIQELSKRQAKEKAELIAMDKEQYGDIPEVEKIVVHAPPAHGHPPKPKGSHHAK